MSNKRLARVRIYVEPQRKADGRAYHGAFDVIVARGDDQVRIYVGLPRSQAATLAKRLGDVLRAEDLADDSDIDGQLVLL